MQKKEDMGTFIIPCTIGLLHFAKKLCDLDASINIITLSIYKKLDLGYPNNKSMHLLMVDRKVKRYIEILHDVLVKVESFIFLVDFMILGWPFLATGRALVDMERGHMKFRLNNEEVTFKRYILYTIGLRVRLRNKSNSALGLSH